MTREMYFFEWEFLSNMINWTNYHEHSLMVFANYDVACAIALLFLYVPRENLVEIDSRKLCRLSL